MSDYYQGAGAVTSAEFAEDGAVFKTGMCLVRLNFYNDGVVRIRVRPGTQTPDFEKTTSGLPIDNYPSDCLVPTLTNREFDAHIELKCGSLNLKINKSVFGIQFSDEKGNIINEDDPTLAYGWIGSQWTVCKQLQVGERFVGLGEKTGPLDKRGLSFVNWNTDAFGFEDGADPLYSSIPFYMGLHEDSAGQKIQYGIFVNNTHKTVFNFGASNNRFCSFTAEGGDIDYFFIARNSVAGIIREFSEIGGHMPLPPLWALGYQQCRYSYYPDSEVVRIAETFRRRDIPCDVIYLDIHYMDCYRAFTWHKERFPQPQKMVDELREMGFETVVIVDPGITIDEDYSPYRQGLEADHFLKYPDGKLYAATVWPGLCHFPDFTRSQTRNWWANLCKTYTDIGLRGIWCDMNEPASWGHNTPDLLTFDLDGKGGTHKEGRNVYGSQMARATYEGMREQLNGRRPFVLTRSGFAGLQQYAALWTGDNVATDDSMLLGLRIVSNLGLCGIPFAGYDVGGFVGNTDSDLFARWVSIAAFSPFFRSHTMINTRASEPWAYGETVEEICRNYIRLRYRLLPYIYSLFYEAHQTGLPIQRSLLLADQTDDRIFDPAFGNQYLLGPNLLIAGAASTQRIVKVYFPEGDWYHLLTDCHFEGGQTHLVECPLHRLTVFAKGSGIIPMCKAVQHTSQPSGPLLEVHLYRGNAASEFEYYEDDGQSLELSNATRYLRKFCYDPAAGELTIGSKKGEFTSSYNQLRLYMHNFDTGTLTINGKETQLQKAEYRFIEPLTNFDPWSYDPDPTIILQLNYIDTELCDETIKISGLTTD